MARVAKHFSIWVVGWALWTAAAFAQSPADRGGDSKVHLTPPAAAIAASTSSLDVSGTWSDTFGFTWFLTQASTSITGDVTTSCDPSNPPSVSGAVTSDTEFYLKATYSGDPTVCAAWFQYNMTSTSPTSASGTWTSANGGSGDVTMTLSSPASAHPVNFQQAGAATVKPDAVLHFDYSWESSTGNLADLGNCTVGEKVNYPGSGGPFSWPSPPYAAGTTPDPTIIWVPGTDGGMHDDHIHQPFLAPYVPNRFVAKQGYRYKCRVGGTIEYFDFAGWTDIDIVRTVKDKTGRGCYKYKITKSGARAAERLPGVRPSQCGTAIDTDSQPVMVPETRRDKVGVSFALPETSVGLNEPIFVDVTISNRQAPKATIDLGLNRKANFEVTVWPAAGGMETRRLEAVGTGRSGKISLAPGKSFAMKLLLNEWYRFPQAGTYRIKIAFLNGSSGAADGPSQEFLVRIGPRNPAHISAVARRLADSAIRASTIEQQMEAASALSYIVDPIAVSQLRRVLDQGKLIEHIVVEGLGRIGTADAIAALRAAQYHPDEDVRSQARSVLRLLQRPSQQERPGD